jgi:hypothetical protein
MVDRYAVRSLLTAVVMTLAVAASAQTTSPALPRTPDGKPDFSGIWQVMNTAAWDIQDHSAQSGVPAGIGVVVGNEIPYKPEALAKKRRNYDDRATADPETKCYLPGVPRVMYMPYPFQIFQKPGQMTMLFEYVHATRYIYTDGTQHPDGHIDWWIRAAAGKATRWWSTSSISTRTPGSIAPATSTAMNCTWSSGSRPSIAITSPTK